MENKSDKIVLLFRWFSKSWGHDFENILLNENSHENMIYEISEKLWVEKLCVLRFI